MADWTPLPNTAVGVGGLPSGTTVTALRDNPVAIAEGAAGAPLINFRALGVLTPGTSIFLRNDTLNEAGTAIETRLSLLSLQYGTIRATFEYRSTLSLRQARVRRRRAGTNETIFEVDDSTSSFIAYAVDFDIIPGDRIQVDHRFSEIQNVRFQNGGELVWPSGIEDIEGIPT